MKNYLEKGVKDNKLILAIFLLVILVIILLYSIINMNSRCQENVNLLNQRVADLSTQLQEKIPEIVSKETVTYKYVCEDGRTVEFSEECLKKTVQEQITIEPVKTREQSTRITNITIAPACVSGYTGGKILYDSSLKPTKVLIEVKDILSNEDYKIAEEFNSEANKWRFFSICGEGILRCPYEGDFSLLEDSYYFVRIVFDYEDIIGKTEYSNDYVVDTREGSEYRTLSCRR